MATHSPGPFTGRWWGKRVQATADVASPGSADRRRRRFRQVTLTGLAAASAAAATLALAGPASAATLPYDNTSPTATGCVSSAYVVGPRVITSSNGQAVGRVELRYSSGCGTNWSGVVSYIGVQPLLAWSVRQADGATTWGGPGGDPGPYSSTTAYSDQLYGRGYVVCAWGAIPDPNNGGAYTGSNYCA